MSDSEYTDEQSDGEHPEHRVAPSAGGPDVSDDDGEYEYGERRYAPEQPGDDGVSESEDELPPSPAPIEKPRRKRQATPKQLAALERARAARAEGRQA